MADDIALLPDTLMAADSPSPARLVLAADGLDKEGKTNFAFSAPKPLVYFDFDIGREGVIEKARKVHPHIIVTKPFAFRARESMFLEKAKAGSDVMRVAHELAVKELERFSSTYYRALNEPVLKVHGVPRLARTLVIDTGGEFWAMLRLAELGKLTGIKPHHYAGVNGMMSEFVRAGMEHERDVNVIWLHRLRSEWKEMGENKSAKTSVLQRDGFEGMSYLAQANVLLYRVPPLGAPTQVRKWRAGEGLTEFTMAPREDAGDLGFRLRVGNCRHNPEMEGYTLANDQVDFKMLAMLMMPDVDPDAWADTV